MAHAAGPTEEPFLYGAAQSERRQRLVHVESIEVRSGAHDWTIGPHFHPDLHQVFFVMEGQGTLRAEARELGFRAPAMIWLPANCVHSFSYDPGADGYVVSVTDELIGVGTRHDEIFAPLRREAECISLDPAEVSGHGLADSFERLAREFALAQPGADLAMEAEFLRIVVALSRLRRAGPQTERASAPDAGLVARYRELIDRKFRTGWALGDYATTLGVSEKRLTRACHLVAGEAPLRLLLRRRLGEAKRLLLYTNLGMADIAEAIGLADAPYFSRFFMRMAGETPSSFRQRHAFGVARRVSGTDSPQTEPAEAPCP